jgi:hypothetical protein
MSIKRIISWLLVVGAVALAERAWGFGGEQPPQNYDNHYALGNAPFSEAAPPSGTGAEIQPFGPVGFDIQAQPFAPAEISDYGNGPQPKTGFFFSYEYLEWTISRPFASRIGAASAEMTESINGVPVDVTNSLNTDFLYSRFCGGDRWEAGYMDTNNTGWMTSVISHVTQTQHATYLTGSTVLFNDPDNFLTLLPISTPPVVVAPIFTQVDVRNRTVLNGIELMRMYRTAQLHYGGQLELLAGVRFFQIEDDFTIGAAGGVWDSSYIDNRVQNDMVGPQLGARWYRQRGRWITSAEGRFMAGVDFQNFHENSTLASNGGPTTVVTVDGATLNLRPMTAQNSLSQSEFAPLGELRLQAAYEITRSVAIKVGYTAIYMGGIARASNTIDYTLPNLGIRNGFSDQTLFAQGLTIGFEINR